MFVIPLASELHATLTEAAKNKRMIFMAGLLGTGKSLLLQQLAMLAHEHGRTVHSLQYDVARKAFQTDAILARYEEKEGITAPEIRLAVDIWARQAVLDWQQSHPDSADLLIAEIPLIGRRLLALTEVRDDALEPFLASEESIFFVPVPSWEVREVIEQKRAATLAEPQNPLEKADASPQVMAALWEEVNTVARDIGLTKANAQTPYNPYIYGGVYERILKNRHNKPLVVEDILEPVKSVYQHEVIRSYLYADEADVQRYMSEVEALESAAVRSQVDSWYQPLVDAALPVARGPELVLPLPSVVHSQVLEGTFTTDLSEAQVAALKTLMAVPIDTPPSQLLLQLEQTLNHFATDNPTVLIETHKHDVYDDYFHVRRTQGDEAQSFIYGLLFSYRNAIANLPNIGDGISIIEMPLLRVALDTTLKQFV